MNTYFILLVLSSLVIISYFFSWIANKTKISSVLLLIVFGIILNVIAGEFNTSFNKEIILLLKILGSVGLVIIVFEASLDLKINKQTTSLLLRTSGTAFIVFFTTSILITGLFYSLLYFPMQSAIVYSIPLSIISSAIAIPTASHLTNIKREFIVYESTFSDIIGILIFNYAIVQNPEILSLLKQFSIDILITIPIAAIFIIFVIWLICFSTPALRLVPILFVILSVYSIAKIFHLPALLLILTLGLYLNNLFLIPYRVKKLLDLSKLQGTISELKSFIIEISFLVRTFFFIVFGYTLHLNELFNVHVLLFGTVVFLTIISIRYASLKMILKSDFVHELFMTPRGLVTIILYFNIPQYLHIHNFNNGIIYFVIILSNILMMAALIFYKEPYSETPEI